MLSISFTLTTVVRSTPKTEKSLVNSLFSHYIIKFSDNLINLVMANNKMENDPLVAAWVSVLGAVQSDIKRDDLMI